MTVIYASLLFTNAPLCKKLGMRVENTLFFSLSLSFSLIRIAWSFTPNSNNIGHWYITFCFSPPHIIFKKSVEGLLILRNPDCGITNVHVLIKAFLYDADNTEKRFHGKVLLVTSILYILINETKEGRKGAKNRHYIRVKKTTRNAASFLTLS